MAEIKDILSLMRGLAPESATEPGFDDNVGLLLGSEKGDSSVVMLCLDCTENVVREAAAAGAVSVSLGKRILRTESAAPFVLACLSYEYAL